MNHPRQTSALSIVPSAPNAPAQPAPLSEVERLGGIVAASPEMRAVIARVKKLARASAPVLITGPSGTGKELVARALHDESPRRNAAFLAINCAALSANVIESELFGHVKGSFTGAVSDKDGAFQAVDGGTLFLDEIGELPLELQPKLLRALESMMVRRVGGTSEEQVDVRIVAATHRDLRVLVEQGMFREDLFHRLVVLAVRIPSLAERPADVMFLARHFLKAEGAAPARFASCAERALLAHQWPGNVRELKNVVTRAAVMCDETTLEDNDLELVDQLFIANVKKLAAVRGVQSDAPEGLSLRDELEALERERIQQALAEHPSQVEAAKALGVPIRTFLNRLDALNIARPRKSK